MYDALWEILGHSVVDLYICVYMRAAFMPARVFCSVLIFFLFFECVLIQAPLCPHLPPSFMSYDNFLFLLLVTQVQLVLPMCTWVCEHALGTYPQRGVGPLHPAAFSYLQFLQ